MDLHYILLEFSNKIINIILYLQNKYDTMENKLLDYDFNLEYYNSLGIFCKNATKNVKKLNTFL
jgi:hypothetical protein